MQRKSNMDALKIGLTIILDIITTVWCLIPIEQGGYYENNND